MLKGLFFGAPSVGECNTLYPVLEEVASKGYEIIAYNLENFAPPASRNYGFRSYPPYKNGYHPACMHERTNTSYLQFGEILVDTAISLTGYLLEEVEKEKPDFILHSHLAVWGRLVADHFQLPAVTLFTTFILDKKIMLSFFEKNKPKQEEAMEHIRSTIRFNKKLGALHQQLQLNTEPDVWDIYVNPKNLNLSFIPGCFQPRRESLGSAYKFLGYPTACASGRLHRDIIYISMGTIFNNNIAFYKLCLKVLNKIGRRAVLVVGKSIDITALGAIPSHIEVVPFTDQAKLLPQAAVFVTRGGMASVQESVYSQTPMVVIPEMTEQQITAEAIEALGIGIHLSPAELSEEVLLQAINRIIHNHTRYAQNLQAVMNNIPKEKAEKAAAKFITTFLENRNVFA